MSTPPGESEGNPLGADATALEASSHGGRSPVFERFGSRDVVDLISEYPLAWVCARGGGAEHASLLPLLAATDEKGELVRLIGHMARNNPLWPKLAADPACLILFQGPQAYVSPETVGDRNWVPTWNFAQLRIEADIRFHLDGGDAALSLLVDFMEQGRDDPWSIEETGPRYREMEKRIIAFDADVTQVRGRFKLAQDETPDVLSAIIDNHPDEALVRWIKRFNEGRY